MIDSETLNNLPMIVLSDCQKCGARSDEFGSCKIQEGEPIDGKVIITECDQCQKRMQ